MNCFAMPLMAEKVVVDLEGKVRLELRPPFAYLH
jgi:hypothetical protein